MGRRGYWTHHTYHQEGCCGGPGCIILLLTLPMWPLISGVMTVKDKMTSSPSTIQAESEADSQSFEMNGVLKNDEV